MLVLFNRIVYFFKGDIIYIPSWNLYENSQIAKSYNRVFFGRLRYRNNSIKTTEDTSPIKSTAVRRLNVKSIERYKITTKLK